MLRIARARIATLERKLKEVRAEREVLRQKHHELEKFVSVPFKCRQRDLMSEASAKKTTNASKTEEMVVENLIRERNELESRLEELQERAQASERRTRAHLEEQRALCDVLQAKLAAKDRATEARVLELQTRVKELENTLDSVRSRSAQLLKIESQAADLIPPKEREPSEREVEMWIELQELQKALAYAEKTAQQYRDDKANLLQSLSDITHDKYDNSAEGKMTAELLEKEKKIIKLRKTVEEQKEREKVMQKTISAYEQQIMELRLEVNCLRSYNDCQKDMPFQDLQTEVIELQMKLMSLSRERKSLLSMSASRALKLERHERAAEQFVRLTRLRRELANLVAPRGTLRPRQFDDIAHNHVSHSLSELCISAAEQWSALQNACARVVLLEKTIMTQKEQLERESRVRTELDRHRERLQRELLEVKGLTKGHTHVPLLTGLTSQIQPPLQITIRIATYLELSHNSRLRGKTRIVVLQKKKFDLLASYSTTHETAAAVKFVTKALQWRKIGTRK
ncbi:hypothetical protein EVAR_8156_1 [Eumeta japonica]|uniref:Uncharacterized protein n=1 Tax=Eumeta variegata TaxID=151549 RepID=A0A4C1TSV2_EUMVA|nr:hypothetical protein EVAR_8156_1 [Eumeta japonica]